MPTHEDFGKFGKEFMDTGLKSFAALSKSMQQITVEAADYSRKAYENGSAAIEKLASAKSPEKVFEIQTDYTREAYEGFMAQATKMGELYAEMAKEVYQPFESFAGRVK